MNRADDSSGFLALFLGGAFLLADQPGSLGSFALDLGDRIFWMAK